MVALVVGIQMMEAETGVEAVVVVAHQVALEVPLGVLLLRIRTTRMPWCSG